VKVLAHVACALLLAAVQGAALRVLGGGVVTVSLLAPWLVYLGLHAGNVDGVLAAAGVGLVLDVMSGTPKGLLTFLAVLLFLVARAVGTSVDVRGRLPFALLSGLGALLLSGGGWLLLRWAAPPEVAPRATVILRAIVEAILTGALAPLLLSGLRRLDRLFEREEPGLLG
jgi:rod shape-determining protein MreD